MRKLPIPVVLAVSPVLVCAAAGITYLILFSINPEFAKIVSSAILGSLVTVYKYLKDKEIKINFRKSLETGTNVKRYTVRWYLIIIYGSLGLLGLTNSLTGIGGVLSAATLGPSGIILISSFVGFVILPTLFFWFGTWVGKKADKNEILIIYSTVIITSFVDYLSLLLISDTYTQSIANQSQVEFRQQMFSLTTLLIRVIYTFICVIITLLGLRRGRRKRLVSHLQDLFIVLPGDIQDTVVDLVYEEATKIASQRVTPTQTT